MSSRDLETVVDFSSLIAWYQKQCNGDWEHSYGVKLETLDNPGWFLEIDLIQTELEGRTMPELSEGCDSEHWAVEEVWIHCAIRDNQFQGACDPTQLARLFRVFEEFRSQARANR